MYKILFSLFLAVGATAGVISTSNPPPPTSATPSGSAGGGLTGTYPNPTVASVPQSAVNLSTVTTALALKRNVGARFKQFLDDPGHGDADAAFSGCVSTATAITTTGGDVLLNFTGSGLNATLGGGCAVWILQDGAFWGVQSSTRPAIYNNSSYVVGSSYFSMNFSNLVNPTPSAGSHTYCYGVGTVNASGTCYIGLASPVWFSGIEE